MQKPLKVRGSHIIKTTIFCLGFMTVAGPSIAEEPEIDYLQSYGEWSLFIDDNDCWLASNPSDQNGETDINTFYYVTFHNNEPRPNNSVFFSVPDSDAGSLILESPTRSYDFSIYGDTAYPNAENELTILKELLIANTFKLYISTLEYGRRELSLSSKGFKNAYNSISKQCEFFPAGDLTTISGHDPA
jgi:hypothetical protein